MWKTGAVARKQIEASLGWLTLPERMAETVPELVSFAAEARGEADRVLVLGAGGAALTPWALAGALEPVEGFPRLSVLDTTEPSAVAAAAADLDPARTLFVVVSRTGAILETNLLFDFFFERAARRLGDGAGRRFVAVTAPGSAVATEAGKRGVRAVFPAEAGATGSFAALSHFGLLPAALAGWNVEELLARARRMAEACRVAGPENPGLLLGASLGAEALAGRDKLTFSLGPGLERFGTWIAALVAAATGKEGKGLAPVEGEPLGAPGDYGSDRLFVRCEWAGGAHPETDQKLATLVEHGHSLAGFVLQDALDLGAEMFRWQFAAAVAARLLGVNPVDESDARDARDRSSRILAGGAPEPAVAAAAASEASSALLASLEPGAYLAIDAFLPERPAIEAALEGLRTAARRSKRVATAVGFAPRVLHVAGQLQKGGRKAAVLQLTTAAGEPLPIPGRPWGFETVFAAQADGDLEALAARGRTVARVRIGPDVERGIADLAAAVGRGRTS